MRKLILDTETSGLDAEKDRIIELACVEMVNDSPTGNKYHRYFNPGNIIISNEAEQIHGLKVEGNTTVIDLMVQNDTFRGIVSGTIRGARTVRINPTGSDTYEVLLEIDKDTLSYLLRQARTVA